ncbi:MAG: SHOCT domain-containing protein [Actinomycetota bacterium]|nr:SHOCT domain-containing protein [Actinomycetota bacterium]
MGFWDFIWLTVWFFLWVAWIWLLIKVFADVFRSDKSGVLKAVWVFILLLLPLLGVLVYLIANGDEMNQRDVDQAVRYDQMQRQYIQQAAGGGASAADEIEKLGALREKGLLTDAEFEAQKAKALV